MCARPREDFIHCTQKILTSPTANERRPLHRIMITMDTTTDGEAIRNGPLSIMRLISTNARERLYVHPVLWTSRHLALLGWEFVDDGFIDVASLPQQSDPPKEELFDDNWGLFSARRFAADTEPSRKMGSLSGLLKGLGVQDRGFNLDFHFNGKVVATLAYSALFKLDPKLLPRPLPPARIAYIHQLDICRWRKCKLISRKLWVWTDDVSIRRHTTPLVEKRYRSLRPANSREDPYIAAVLVGLAQAQRLDPVDGDAAPENSDKTSPSRITSSPRVQTVLLSHPADKGRLHVFTSRISHELLDRFDFPSRPPPADAQSRQGMTISHRRLALKPIKTLQRRLGLFLRHVASQGTEA
ncbi:hypothetical protein MAPG_11807 [Magnaporthiopsis poae ATCC 64411]|uniref:Uncharacterized protein n=1 Tax=Magnaporthiopsis poae (strain ATCC 64411 / 73-15) TaxID=644358 RepID=A0A0C4EG83_MAGP6|nr:hypothetical protein MAPG_11807 [Magnaporthiopsis poae ATCC 64411]